MFEVQNKVAGFFTEVSGIGSETEVVEHKVVTKDGKSDFVQKIPGRLKWGDITLKRGITSELDVYSWRKLVEDGKVATARANGSIYARSGGQASRAVGLRPRLALEGHRSVAELGHERRRH